jgi:hypothetical protein
VLHGEETSCHCDSNTHRQAETLYYTGGVRERESDERGRGLCSSLSLAGERSETNFAPIRHYTPAPVCDE